MDLRSQLQTTMGAGYRIERELGGGGMSHVYVATEMSLGRQVVVKVLSPDLAQEVSAERFRAEVQVSASLQHPHIVPVLSAGAADGVLFYTMPLIAGESLRARLLRTGECSVAETVSILRDVTRALAYAHRHGIAHRDIKPENVMLSEDGAVVLDFGIAKALSASTLGEGSTVRTGIGVTLGTPNYMSPEQAAGDPSTDHRSDLYSLGILAYEMLLGFSPFAGRPLKAVFVAHASEVPERVDRRRQGVPKRLADLIVRCLEKRPSDRPASAEEVLRVLDEVAAAESSAPAAGRASRTWLAAASFVAVAMVLAVAYLASRDGGGGAAVDVARTTAVLPFTNLSGAREDDAFSDGMTEELIGALGSIDGLRVKSAFSLRGTGADVREVGRQLDVETVVSGSVRRAGNSLRIFVRLENVADGFQLWSDNFQRDIRDPADVFRVQDEIAAAIVDALKLRLGARATDRASRHPDNLEAYQAYLSGRFFMAKRSSDGLRQAVEMFQRAVALDSTYALAWAGLADAEALSLTYGFIRPAERYARARAAAERALAIDSTMAEAYASLGYLGLNYSWDWPAVERAFATAIAHDPNYATAHHWRSLYYNVVGRRDDALRSIRLARELDPVSLIVNREIGRAHYYVGEIDSAMVHYRRTLELDPSFASAFVWIARAHIARGDYAGAIRELQDRPDFQGGHSNALLAFAHARSGNRETARTILAELQARARREYVWPLYLAVVHLGLGERDEALQQLEIGVRTRSPQIAYLKVDPIFTELRGHPRFVALVRELGLE